MSGRQPSESLPPVTRSQLEEGLRALGVSASSVVMVHTSMRALGWVVGGPETIVRALLSVLGPDGTLMAYAGWDQDPYHLEQWPASVRDAARRELPPFDPALSEANRDHGRIPERMRTWPGAVRGPHPEASMVAIGRNAAALVAPHADDDPYGTGTPLERLVALDGSVLLLGAPLDAVTLLHHAEAIAPIEAKRRAVYDMPMLADGVTVWRTFHDIDTSTGAFDYARLGLAVDPFEQIVRDALGGGIGRSGAVGASTSVLLPTRQLTEFAVGGMVDRTLRPTRRRRPRLLGVGSVITDAWIVAWADRYDVAFDDARIGTIVGKASPTYRDIEQVYRWKSARAIGHFQKNPKQLVTKRVRSAIAEPDQAVALASLLELRGVKARMASAILAVFRPERYTVMDWRAWESLTRHGLLSDVQGLGWQAAWPAYLAECRRIAGTHRVTLRELDRALWGCPRRCRPATSLA